MKRRVDRRGLARLENLLDVPVGFQPGASEPTPEELEHERQRTLLETKAEAIRLNEKATNWGHKDPPFLVEEDGVYAACDGLLMASKGQLFYEEMYWLHVGCPFLLHDEDGEAFYSVDGTLALNRRDFINVSTIGRSRSLWERHRELEAMTDER